ncbi:hypothetical protein [Azotosporobacter soli]|uniref:hypothetical protein n=1 Tax=Azotosporobacter soli TaxID=3055040 RepID=UPI0031FE6737
MYISSLISRYYSSKNTYSVAATQATANANSEHRNHYEANPRSAQTRKATQDTFELSEPQDVLPLSASEPYKAAVLPLRFAVPVKQDTRR